MSTIATNNITDAAGSGAPNFTNGLKLGTAGVLGPVTGAAPMYACRAWVNFNGTGTVAIRASGNVSSITDNGTGDYTVNFTTAMPDTNYFVATGAVGRNTSTSLGSVGFFAEPPSLISVNSVRIVSNNAAGYSDASVLGIAIFR